MTTLLIVGAIVFLIWLWFKPKEEGSRNTSTSTTQAGPPRSAEPSPRQSPPEVYRPQRRVSPKIKFVEPTPTSSQAGDAFDQTQVSGLCDAFSGARLDIALGLFRCSKCHVFYHSESYDVLRSENRGQCVACSSTSIVALTGEKGRHETGRNFTPDAVTLSNFAQHFGHVITFEGVARSVRVSKRGKDYAVMFENKPWSRGLKLVFFRGSIRKVGGSDYIQRMSGRTITVRGLLINHERYGPEIIVSEKSMILGVR